MRACSQTVIAMSLAFALSASAQENAGSCKGPQEACRQIVALGKRYDAAFNRRDAVSLAGLFAADGIVVQPGPTLSGRQAIQAAYSETFKKGPGSNSQTSFVEVRVLGDVAWAVGSWKADSPGPNNTTEQRHGGWGEVAIKRGGTWKLQMLTWNLIQNAPEMETAANPALENNPAQRQHLNQEGAKQLEKEGK